MAATPPPIPEPATTPTAASRFTGCGWAEPFIFDSKALSPYPKTRLQDKTPLFPPMPDAFT
jgi:hypothetical protein